MPTPIPTDEEFSVALREAIASQEAADAHQAAVTKMLSQALRALIKPGQVIESYQRPLGRVNVTHGNGRGARRFEVVSEPRVRSGWGVHHISLAKFSVEAYPLNDAGKRMSGRSGNSKSLARPDAPSTVVLDIQVAADHGPDDQRSDLEMVLATLAAARKA